MRNYKEIKELIGKTLTNIEKIGEEELIFTTTEGDKYKMYHNQDCCESVSIDDIVGDLEDLIGSPILKAEETTSSEYTPEELEEKEKQKLEQGDDYYDYYESFTWTFYHFATIKGYVTIKWYGQSNGYYSESVDFIEMGNEQF